MDIRPAVADELPAVMAVLEGALLEVDTEVVDAAIEADRVLVADDGGPVVGALLLEDDIPTDGARVDAVAVRPGRRDQGVGTALVGAAADAYGRLVAEFDAEIRPFWVSLDFDVQPSTVPGRYVALRRDPAANG
jgi:GNAT superfamily N-acetyltransferase